MSNREIRVPNIGEFKDVEVIEVLITNGQTVIKNDPLITIESDKSSVEIPSYYDGKIVSVNIKVGDKVSEGDIILVLENIESIKKDDKSQLNIEKNYTKEKPQKKEITEEILNKNLNKNDEKKLSLASPKARKFA
ncbi:biotin/lipoyl-binding protein, partial [Candidatus Pelagibacter bacterium]|nr:biotin/lipoyl-binding protein [Candidatus Pelagibacter bacterium]